jgi:hypothetical protein
MAETESVVMEQKAAEYGDARGWVPDKRTYARMAGFARSVAEEISQHVWDRAHPEGDDKLMDLAEWIRETYGLEPGRQR